MIVAPGLVSFITDAACGVRAEGAAGWGGGTDPNVGEGRVGEGAARVRERRGAGVQTA